MILASFLHHAKLSSALFAFSARNGLIRLEKIHILLTGSSNHSETTKPEFSPFFYQICSWSFTLTDKTNLRKVSIISLILTMLCQKWLCPDSRSNKKLWKNKMVKIYDSLLVVGSCEKDKKKTMKEMHSYWIWKKKKIWFLPTALNARMRFFDSFSTSHIRMQVCSNGENCLSFTELQNSLVAFSHI